MTTGIVLIAHGSPLASANAELYALAELVRAKACGRPVEPAFLEKTSPSIAEGIDACVLQGANRILLIPYFLLLGRHVSVDLPRIAAENRLRHPQVEIVLGEHLGYHRVLAEIVLERIQEAKSPGKEGRDDG